MALDQKMYPVGMTTDSAGYPIPKVFIEGHNYQELTLFNAQAIRNTSVATSSTVSMTTLSGQNNILVNNALDQSVLFDVFIKNTLGQSFPVLIDLSIPAGGTKVLTDVDIPVLKTPIYQLYATVQASVAPTTGAFSATLGGVQA
ncbi:hypothetical protein [Ectobacillus ponti]|uniref:Uncharacterized protein n=1 Tax=Ectobacillus ponti TaxID=2961894 RepID=A0AA42BQT4_9BACI|nr:hypothetical protein [Ectobacillus ponti]MCP8969716.1 hypothetical protein [Ectobacillus ponti]